MLQLAVLGAGMRGREAYGGWVLRHPERARIVAVADRQPARRDGLADAAGVPLGDRFADWRPLLAAAPRLGLDAVVVALPDTDHVDPALAAAEQGLAVLLEKPVAPTATELERLSAGARERDGRIAVGHVLRFTPFWRTVHRIVAGGAIGQLATIRLEENIGFWHFAHSYVRGNWRRIDEASPMVLSKTCHDLDLIRWLAGGAPEAVSSVGSLTYFRPEHAPAGAPQRCLDGCPAAERCPFYAPRFYAEALAGTHSWPVSVLGPDTSPAGRMAALRIGPYGRCVFRSDNDVVDHQQTLLSFPDGVTATLSTSAFTGQNTRTVRITGTAGELAGHLQSGELTVDLFAPGAELPELPLARHRRERTAGPLGHRVVELAAAPEHGGSDPDDRGHSGGDAGLMDAFVTAVAGGSLGADHGSSLESALDSHRMAFAAEESRRTSRTVLLPEIASI